MCLHERVDQRVLVEVSTRCALLSSLLAFERPFAGMRPQVFAQMTLVRKCSWALQALVRNPSSSHGLLFSGTFRRILSLVRSRLVVQTGSKRGCVGLSMTRLILAGSRLASAKSRCRLESCSFGLLRCFSSFEMLQQYRVCVAYFLQQSWGSGTLFDFNAISLQNKGGSTRKMLKYDAFRTSGTMRTNNAERCK